MADSLAIREEQGFAMLAIAARRGAIAADIEAAIAGKSTILMGSGPGTWLAHSADADAEWSGQVRQALAGLASVSDQSAAYRLFRIAGPQARTLLQRGAYIDLHDSAFAPGAVAITAIAHVDVVIRRLEDDEGYAVAVYRSFTASFLRWLDATRAGIDG